ncbi:MAG: hypothetical protein HY321_13835 [Armatimonadetes bacterium]|nr:hypothetical protein [Armatimonadota bacterium]
MMGTNAAHVTRMAVGLSVVGLLVPYRADAYIDPGTGSYVLQLGLAMVFGAVYSVKVYWRELRRFMVRRAGRPGRK